MWYWGILLKFLDTFFVTNNKVGSRPEVNLSVCMCVNPKTLEEVFMKFYTAIALSFIPILDSFGHFTRNLARVHDVDEVDPGTDVIGSKFTPITT
jgi:hypothetical protein